ncbi:sigma-54-dependent Fis family transcriptional regulator [bacterium]|nr:sigma-54-dependent Fis family transcriptional regulator [bacterium]
MNSVLVATRHTTAVESIRSSFADEFEIDATDSYDGCLELFSRKRYEFLIIDVDLLRSRDGDKTSYAQRLQPFWSVFPEAEIIVLTSQDTIRQAVNAVKAGASNYFTYPIDPAEIHYVIESIHREQQLYSELKYLRDKFWRPKSHTVLYTKNPGMKMVFEKVRSVAPAESTVLLTGETGTGKGVIAKLIHEHSRRSSKQYISVHCGAIPDTLLESELFGHEKGAFTGADRRKLGKFEIADQGTIFLDEIGTISAPMQIKLLQVLQDKTFQRVGGEATLKADVRIIAATNSDLQAMCDEGSFRRDLYYRLNVFPIEIPPLRRRKEDIPSLVEHFLERWNRLSRHKISGVDRAVIEALQRYEWPGNIRELENLIERAYVLEQSSVLTPTSFPAELFSERAPLPGEEPDYTLPLPQARGKAVAAFEHSYLTRLLVAHEGKINRSAAAAGITPRQLHKLLARYGIKKEDFKASRKKSAKSE